ncbi:MAG: class II aldolase/adducin family protein [Candidatus Omnitrophota bacterium]|nr:class II aldolase/adducin family protein [Candidatus Omnitrophota bacterium]
MIFGKEKSLQNQMINTGRKLVDLHLVAATAGNLSCRIDEENILITATGTALGNLKAEDIIKVNIVGAEKREGLSTEFPLHKLIYQSFPAAKSVIHCHPPLVNGYFAVYPELKNLTFESKLYLGKVPLVAQETPAITKPELVIEALKTNNLVVIKNHGVVAIADEFTKGLNLIESLEEAVKIAAVARLFDKAVMDDLDQALKNELSRKAEAYAMFSREHIQAIVELVNRDEFIARKGAELDLTLQYAIKLDGSEAAYKFIFEKGRIIKLEFDANAPFVASAPAAVWEMVFLGKLDPFVAVTQGKMKLQGQLGQLAKWYVPFSRLFELFRQVKIK